MAGLYGRFGIRLCRSPVCRSGWRKSVRVAMSVASHTGGRIGYRCAVGQSLVQVLCQRRLNSYRTHVPARRTAISAWLPDAVRNCSGILGFECLTAVGLLGCSPECRRTLPGSGPALGCTRVVRRCSAGSLIRLRHVFGSAPGRSLNPKVRVPCNLPKIAFRVGKITRVTAPKCVLDRLDERGACRYRYIQQGIHLLLRADVVCQGDTGKAAAFRSNTHIGGQGLPGIQGQSSTPVPEEGNGFGVFVNEGQPQSVAVELHRAGQVGNGQGNNADARFHGKSLLIRERLFSNCVGSQASLAVGTGFCCQET